MIGVVVPAHNEEVAIAACLASIERASRCPGLGGETVETIVVLDRCSDWTEAIAASFDVTMIAVDAGNVGRARAAGTALAIARGARWICCTDADSRVPDNWISGQLALRADAFCGMVEVEDWLDYSALVRRDFDALHLQVWNHPHVHGANLGFSAVRYLECGGFPPQAAHEDVALVAALTEAGARIARAPAPRVTTSARRLARAAYGFSEFLGNLEAALQASATEDSLRA